MSQDTITIREVATAPKRPPRARLKRETVHSSKPHKKPKVKPRSVSKLKKQADAIFSKYIRARDNHTCYTCKLFMEPNKSQNGHFVPRQYLALRYDEVNCHAQCYACNVLYNGQPSAYAARLERDYGKGTVEMLESKRKEIIKNFPYEYWIEIFSEKLINTTHTQNN